jgi:hypothetical protein
MARGVAAFAVLATLAVPATADAASKSVKLRMPADGEISFARYTVTAAKPGDLTIRRANRLGSSMILSAVRPLSRRKYEVTVLLVNPGSGASAAQGGSFWTAIFELGRGSGGGVTKTGEASNVVTQPLTTLENASVNRFCQRPPPRRAPRTQRRGRGFYSSRGSTAGNRRRIRVLFTPEVCQDQAPTETSAASRQLRELGVTVPGCTGRVERYQGSPNEVSAQMVCTQSTNVFSLRAPTGNQGSNCLGPQGSACAYGQFCAPMPRESTCYGDSNGFDSDTLLEFRAAFAQPVEPQDIRGIWVPQGSPVVTEEHAYLRLVLDTP